MTIYLYVKTHRKTGLKYLGKTEQKDPHTYRGSGKLWRNHIKKHGYDVETEILRECQSNEEVRQWGLYYSELWDVVNSKDEHGKKTWANLKEEAGDGGCTSEQARQNAQKRVEDGTHNFLGGEIQRQNNLKRITDGIHHFLDNHYQIQNNLKRVANGTHHLLSGEIQRQNNLKRVANGTHHFLGGEMQRQRVENGTHHLLSGEIQRQNNLNRVANGTHPSQMQWTCVHCGTSGKGTGMFTRWHGDNCKNK